MSHEELKRRIRNMKQGGLLRMSPSNFAMLTDKFCEELVEYILIQAETNERQCELIKVIKDKYGEWRREIGDITWDSPFTGKRYPEYIDKFDFEIDCGDTIVDDSQEIGSWDDDYDDDDFINHTIDRPGEENMQLEAVNEQLKAENEQLKAENEELESKLEKAKKQVADLEKQNKEQKDSIELLSSDIPEIDAQQKVRMELARKIMSEAGMNAAFMDLRGRKKKVATLMGTMLDIPTHTCASWLSSQELNRETHQKSIKEINDIFEALGLAIRV